MGGLSSKSEAVPGGQTATACGRSGERCSRDSSLRDCGESGFAKKKLHQGPIVSLCALQHDCILSGGADKDVNLYDWKQESHLAKFGGPTKDVTKICYNSTSNFVFAASRDRSLYGWKWPIEGTGCTTAIEEKPSQTVEPITILQGHSLGVTALDCNNEYHQLLCSGSRDNSVCLWDLDVGKPVSSMYAPRNLVTDLKWIINEKAVIQASEDKTLRVWDLSSCSTVQHFRARNYLQTCCSVSRDRQQFLSGSSGSGNMGGEVTVWDRRNEKRPLKVFKGHSESVESCMFISHGDRDVVCSVGKDSTIRLWELDSGQELTCQLVSDSGSLTSVVSLEEDILACSSFSSGVSLWKLSKDVDSPLTLIQQYL